MNNDNGTKENAEMSDDGDTRNDGNDGSEGGDGDNTLIPPPDQVSSSADSSDFDVPPVGEDDVGNGDSDSSETGIDTNNSTVQKILGAKALLEEKLSEAASLNAMSLSAARGIDAGGIVGVGVSGGSIPGENCLVVYVESESSQEAVRREMVDVMSVNEASDDSLPIEVEVTGVIDARTTNRSRFRPAPGGVSVGHHDITAGTIGGWAAGRSGTRARRLLMLSNNHVLANTNRGKFGDSIIQPGRADSGANPADRIAILERFIPVNFASGSINYVDCATGWCWPNRVRRDHVYHAGNPTARYFKIGNSVRSPAVNMLVGKTGRTTDLTRGTIRAVQVSVNVNFGPAGVAHFRDQFAVRSASAGNFSAGGDSGSIVWEWKAGLSPVGLLFAGGGGTTFCNRISRVYNALRITPF